MPLENEKIEVAEEKETEMPNVEELLKILLDVNLEQNRQTVHLLMNYMNDIEEISFPFWRNWIRSRHSLHRYSRSHRQKKYVIPCPI